MSKSFPPRVVEIYSGGGLIRGLYEVGSNQYIYAQKNPDKIQIGREYISLKEHAAALVDLQNRIKDLEESARNTKVPLSESHHW